MLLTKNHSESITDYIISAENISTALNAAEKVVSDSLLAVIVLKGLPGNHTAFVAKTMLQERIQDFQKFK